MMPVKNHILIILSLGLLPVLGWAQTPDKAKLENERKAIQKEISEIQGVYNQVKGQKR